MADGKRMDTTSAPLRVLITGAARAIGAATATELTQAGHQVVATARDVSLLKDLDVAERLELDVTDGESVRRAIRAAGDLDVIVNNAAVCGKGPLENYPLDRLRTIFETNTLGPLSLVQEVLPAWRRRGSGVVVNVSSVQGKVAAPLEGPYSASKFALEALSESLHYELRHFGIRVVIVEPGFTAPGMKGMDGVPGDTDYRQLWEEWEMVEVNANGPDGRPGPEPVAVAIRSAIENPDTPLRVPVGQDAATILESRARLDDASFEMAMRESMSLTW
jgi:NAD(P)-dependent dehydrogenase (short-subunit alcohol dehydrogenase family)